MAQDPLVRREPVSASCNRRPMRVWRHKNTAYTRWRLSNGLGVYLSWLQAGFSHHSGHVTSANIFLHLFLFVSCFLIGPFCWFLIGSWTLDSVISFVKNPVIWLVGHIQSVFVNKRLHLNSSSHTRLPQSSDAYPPPPSPPPSPLSQEQ
jgi:hypothetical protein